MGDASQSTRDYFSQNNRLAGTLFGGAGAGEDYTGQTAYGERVAPQGFSTGVDPATPASGYQRGQWRPVTAYLNHYTPESGLRFGEYAAYQDTGNGQVQFLGGPNGVINALNSGGMNYAGGTPFGAQPFAGLEGWQQDLRDAYGYTGVGANPAPVATASYSPDAGWGPLTPNNATNQIPWNPAGWAPQNPYVPAQGENAYFTQGANRAETLADAYTQAGLDPSQAGSFARSLNPDIQPLDPNVFRFQTAQGPMDATLQTIQTMLRQQGALPPNPVGPPL